MTLDEKISRFVDVLVRVALDIQEGQTMVIRNADIELAEVVRMAERVAYEAGAKQVNTVWSDRHSTRTMLELAPDEAIESPPTWKADLYYEHMVSGDAFLSLNMSDPDFYSGVDPNRLSAYSKSIRLASHRLLDIHSKTRVNWTGTFVPTDAWAAKVFPELPSDDRSAALWDLVFSLCRLDAKDPVEAWNAHIGALESRAAELNAARFASLHFEGPGTDLTVGLAERHLWKTARMRAMNGTLPLVNFPTEEVFTAPHAQRVNGVVAATMPLHMLSGGTLVEDIRMEIRDGRIISATASAGQEALNGSLETDEAARYLGEVALVPQSSPIAKSGRIFYNTLYDENASCHIAFGNTVAVTIEGGPEMDEATYKAAGGNKSMTHVDFMIGSDQVDVTGITTAGDRVPVMRGGEWAE